MQIVHLTARREWDAAQAAGAYRTSTVGLSLDEVGFIHASTPEQVAATAQRFFRDYPDELVVLVLDDDDIRSAGTDVRYEDAGNGELFPHIYGPIALSWVRDVRPARFEPDGTFTY